MEVIEVLSDLLSDRDCFFPLPEDMLVDCKVVLVTLRTELVRIQDGGYTAVDPTSPGLSTLYQSFMV